MKSESSYRFATLGSDVEWYFYHAPPETIELHEHDFHEIYLHFSGELSYHAGNFHKELSVGDVLLIPAGTLHRPVFSNCALYSRLVIWIRPQYLSAHSTPQTDISACFSPQRPLLLQLTAEQLAALRQQLQEAEHSEFGGDILLTNAITSFLVWINAASHNLTQTGPQTMQGGRYSALLSYIHTHFREPLSVDLLASQFFVSKYHLLREFKKHHGITLHRYITLVRLAQAKRLLLDEISISDVPALCGFGEYSAFLAAFKHTYGITPRQFQRLMKQS